MIMEIPFYLKLNDDQYPIEGKYHQRNIVRAVVFNDKNEIALTKLLATDKFGLRDYYELPGGGVNAGEDYATALKREMQEELGYEIENIQFIGLVNDFYNLINRENFNYFYTARTTKFVGQHLEEKEKQLIEKIVWVPLEEAINLYQNMHNVNVGKLVKQRELPILKMVAQATIQKA